MKQRETILPLSRDKGGNSGIRLYNDDLLLLQQLLVHQSMNFKSVYELLQQFETVPGQVREVNAVSNRLKKLRDAGIIVLRMRKHKGNVFTSHYRIGKRGFEVLHYFGYITEKEVHSLYEIIRKLHLPSEHTQGASYIANQIFLRNFDNESIANLEHYRGSAHPQYGFSEFLSKEERGVVIPDWVFTSQKTDICIEVDTGSQRGDIIANKCKSYIKRANQLKDKGRTVVVVFSVIDATVAVLHDYSENRSRRIASLKELVPPFTEWPSNLNFFVVSARRTPPLVENLLEFTGHATIDEQHTTRNYLAEDLLRKARYVLEKGYLLDIIDKDSVFNPRRNKSLDCDLLVSIKKKKREFPTYYALIHGKEGSVFTSQMIEVNEKRIYELNSKNKHKIEILVFYDTEVAMIEDVYGRSTNIQVWQTDTRSWINAMNELEAVAPPIYKVVTPYKKEPRSIPI